MINITIGYREKGNTFKTIGRWFPLYFKNLKHISVVAGALFLVGGIPQWCFLPKTC